MEIQKRWIWQQEGYPDFTYDREKLEPLLQQIKYHQGILDGIYQTINDEERSNAQMEVLTSEAVETSAIEGEMLDRNSVRSSIAKRLGIDTGSKDSSTTHTDGVVDILLDATQNHVSPLSEERLFGWHNALFPKGYSGLYKINVAAYRDEEEMQIVSGAIGKEKVHYVAPPKAILEQEMARFMAWFNDDTDLSVIKAGIAHLWFVIIHPLEDGNGRIARALSDLLLAREARQTRKLYSISHAIRADRKGYYAILEKTTTGGTDITPWLTWFLNILLQALQNAREGIRHILDKAAFWDRHRNTVLNERQIKVLNRLLDTGTEQFEGGMNTRKYASLTKTSKPTASREIKDLVEKGCLVQIEGTAGRNVSYEVNIGEKPSRIPEAVEKTKETDHSEYRSMEGTLGDGLSESEE